jgi:hypothetical protein
MLFLFISFNKELSMLSQKLYKLYLQARFLELNEAPEASEALHSQEVQAIESKLSEAPEALRALPKNWTNYIQEKALEAFLIASKEYESNPSQEKLLLVQACEKLSSTWDSPEACLLDCYAFEIASLNEAPL